MAAKKLNLLAAEDKTEYMGLIKDEIASGLFSADVHVSQINQMFDMGPDMAYIGAWIALDGPMVTHSYGPEPAYRKWLLTDADWNIKLFDNIRPMFIYIAEKFSPVFHFKPYYRIPGDEFELNGVMEYGTYNLSNYAGKVV